jgi:hypothetical protein
MKLLSCAAYLFIMTFISCGNGNTPTPLNTDTSATQNQTKEKPASGQTPFGTIYASKAFRPDNVTEFLQVGLSDDYTKIVSVFYWTDRDPQPIQLTIHSQEYVDGEISGFTAKISFPGNDEIIGLGLIEDQANLTFADGTFQEYIAE